MKVLTEEQLKREAKRLIKAGKMPSAEELCAAVLEARKKYANQIRRARREAREEIAGSGKFNPAEHIRGLAEAARQLKAEMELEEARNFAECLQFFREKAKQLRSRATFAPGPRRPEPEN